MKYRSPLIALAALALLAACDKQRRAGDDNGAQDMRDTLEDIAAEASEKSGRDTPNAPLKPGQSVQGTIQADVGKGTQAFRSLSTKVADDIGQQMDEKLKTGEGQRALDKANRTLDKLGTGTQVDAADVRDIVGSMAGKTFHDSTVMVIDIINSLSVNLKGTAADGSILDLGLSFDDKTLKLTDASLSFRPKPDSMFEFFDSKNVQVTIERFERNADGSYVLAGTFDAKDLPASKLAKELKGKTHASASGRFDFAALPEKQMPKVGR